MSGPALRFANITFGFGKQRILFENLSVTLVNNLSKGKIIALMGPSGVGKTSFCDLAMGTKSPQKGIVKFEPNNVNIAVIPQRGVIFEELSVRENITCLKYSKSLGETFCENRVQHAVESLNLSKVLMNGTRAMALSGGEAQRVMLARIQTINCDILILDEPCSFLDNHVKDSFLSALRATVDERKILALMVTHVWDEARLIADEVIFFRQDVDSSVKLEHIEVEHALESPPTLDALFGIHWPDCIIFDRSGITQLPYALSCQIPKNAHSVGVVHCKKGDSAVLAKALMAELNSNEWNHDCNRRILKKFLSHGEYVRCLFYNENGMLLPC